MTNRRQHIRRGSLARLAAAALAGTLALGVGACSGSSAGELPDSAAAAAPPVLLGAQDVAEARVAPISAGVTLTGSLMPAQSVTLTAQVAGTVTDVRVDRGTPVRRGQRLATIDAQGVRSQATGARANVAAAQAAVALAQQRLNAARTLYEAGATSRIDYQTAQASYENAEAQLAAARAQAVGASEAAARTTLTAPITGAVSTRAVESGESVAVGDPLFTIVDASTLELSAQIPVEQAARVRVGQPVTFTLGSDPTRELRGRVARMDPAADPATRQVGVYTQLANPGGRIIAGQYATGRVIGERVAEAIVVPLAAVRSEGSERYALVIENSRIVRRAVETGARDEAAGVVEVTSGVAAGELVLATAGATLAEGTVVTVAADAAARPATPPAARNDTGAAAAAAAPQP